MTPLIAGWHLTWQDPVALALVVAVLLATWWLRRRLSPSGCAGCAHAEAHGKLPEAAREEGAASPAGAVIPLSSLRIARRPRTGEHDGAASRQRHT